MLLAITRAVSDSLAHCKLSHLPRSPINIPRAIAQHAAYENALRSVNVQILQAPPAPDLPDAVFVEDTAIVLDEIAIITRPGAPSRRPEIPAIAHILQPYRPLHHLTPPATLDGGDVLRIGQTLYVGRSQRTNDAAITQLRHFVQPWGYQVTPLDIHDCLHLKSAATLVSPNLILLNPAWLSPAHFPDLECLPIDPHEPYAANALPINNTILYPAHFPRTRQLLENRGLKILPLPCDELAKAEGAVTCCSILVTVP